MNIDPGNLFVIWPFKSNCADIRFVLADAGDAGHRAIAAAYPDLKVAFDGNEIGDMSADLFDLKPMRTWRSFFRDHLHFVLIVIEQGRPVDKIVVRAVSLEDAIGFAHKRWPTATFDTMGVLEQISAAVGILRDFAFDENLDYIEKDLRSDGVMAVEGMDTVSAKSAVLILETVEELIADGEPLTVQAVADAIEQKKGVSNEN